MEIEAAYRHCRQIAAAHYENFPVASLLLPPRLRDPVAAIYCFARRADDLADEGEEPPAARLYALAELEQQLRESAAGRPDREDSLWLALNDTITRYRLPLGPFLDLLSAFRQDIIQQRYADFGELMAYCRRSANPVGRLLLMLNGAHSPRQLGYSDAICSALQLINFYQDLADDLAQRDRIYIPQDELERFGVSEEELRSQRDSPAIRQLLAFQYQRAGHLLASGAVLPRTLPGRFGWELRLIIAGGWQLLEKLRRRGDPFARPRLSSIDAVALLGTAIRLPRA